MRRVPLRRLAAEPLVLFPREQAPGYHDLLTARLAATGTVPRVVQDAPETITIIGLVAAGIGVSPVAASVANLALPGVVYRPLAGAPDTELVVVRRADDDSPLTRAFVAAALEQSAAGPRSASAGGDVDVKRAISAPIWDVRSKLAE